VLQHRALLILVMVLTVALAAVQALYPLVINHTFEMIDHATPAFSTDAGADRDITSTKAAIQYAQSIAVQSVVMLVIRALQGKMFNRLGLRRPRAVEREAPAQLSSRFTTDAVTIREAMVRAVNAVGDATMLVGLAPA